MTLGSVILSPCIALYCWFTAEDLIKLSLPGRIIDRRCCRVLGVAWWRLGIWIKVEGTVGGGPSENSPFYLPRNIRWTNKSMLVNNKKLASPDFGDVDRGHLDQPFNFLFLFVCFSFSSNSCFSFLHFFLILQFFPFPILHPSLYWNKSPALGLDWVGIGSVSLRCRRKYDTRQITQACVSISFSLPCFLSPSLSPSVRHTHAQTEKSLFSASNTLNPNPTLSSSANMQRSLLTELPIFYIVQEQTLSTGICCHWSAAKQWSW